MQNRFVLVVLAVALVIAGCTTADGAPATAPSTSSTPSTSAATTSTSTPTTTIAPQTTTTLDRLVEIQAILEDLEYRRVEALWAGDAESFLALFVENPYKEQSRGALDFATPGEPPDLEITVLDVLKDDADCLVIVASTSVVSSDGDPTVDTTTLQPLPDGWGYAYVAENRGGWLCDEPHPLSG